MKATLFAVGGMAFLCKVKTQLATRLRPRLDGQHDEQLLFNERNKESSDRDEFDGLGLQHEASHQHHRSQRVNRGGWINNRVVISEENHPYTSRVKAKEPCSVRTAFEFLHSLMSCSTYRLSTTTLFTYKI